MPAPADPLVHVNPLNIHICTQLDYSSLSTTRAIAPGAYRPSKGGHATCVKRQYHADLQNLTPPKPLNYIYVFICTYIHTSKHTYIHTYTYTYIQINPVSSTLKLAWSISPLGRWARPPYVLVDFLNISDHVHNCEQPEPSHLEHLVPRKVGSPAVDGGGARDAHRSRLRQPRPVLTEGGSCLPRS